MSRLIAIVAKVVLLMLVVAPYSAAQGAPTSRTDVKYEAGDTQLRVSELTGNSDSARSSNANREQATDSTDASDRSTPASTPAVIESTPTEATPDAPETSHDENPSEPSNGKYVESTSNYDDGNGNYLTIGINKNPFESGPDYLQDLKRRMTSLSDSETTYTFVDNPPEGCVVYEMSSSDFELVGLECASDEYIVVAVTEDEASLREVAARFNAGEESLVPDGFKLSD